MKIYEEHVIASLRLFIATVTVITEMMKHND